MSVASSFLHEELKGAQSSQRVFSEVSEGVHVCQSLAYLACQIVSTAGVNKVTER